MCIKTILKRKEAISLRMQAVGRVDGKRGGKWYNSILIENILKLEVRKINLSQLVSFLANHKCLWTSRRGGTATVRTEQRTIGAVGLCVILTQNVWEERRCCWSLSHAKCWNGSTAILWLKIFLISATALPTSVLRVLRFFSPLPHTRP